MEQMTNRVVNAAAARAGREKLNNIPAPPPPDIQRFCR